MAKFYGPVGFGETVTVNGVSDDVITERTYRGDVVRNARRLLEGEKVNPDITTENSISIVADEYANEHIFAIRYLRWAGTLWTVSEVVVESPRLICRLGGVYNGPTPEVAGAP